MSQRAQPQGNQTQPRATLDPSCLNDVRYVVAFALFNCIAPIHTVARLLGSSRRIEGSVKKFPSKYRNRSIGAFVKGTQSFFAHRSLVISCVVPRGPLLLRVYLCRAVQPHHNSLRPRPSRISSQAASTLCIGCGCPKSCRARIAAALPLRPAASIFDCVIVASSREFLQLLGDLLDLQHEGMMRLKLSNDMSHFLMMPQSSAAARAHPDFFGRGRTNHKCDGRQTVLVIPDIGLNTQKDPTKNGALGLKLLWEFAGVRSRPNLTHFERISCYGPLYRF